MLRCMYVVVFAGIIVVNKIETIVILDIINCYYIIRFYRGGHEKFTSMNLRKLESVVNEWHS